MQRKPCRGTGPTTARMMPCKIRAVSGRRLQDTMDFLANGSPRRIDVTQLVIAGWTGRDKASVERHIVELAAIGVRRPRAVPMFYRVGASLLTTAREVEVVGENSSGEVEFVL